MPRIVALIEVDDLAIWEANFLTHGELFRDQTIRGMYEYTMIEDGNRVVLSADVEDIDTFFEKLKSKVAQDAIDADVVKRDSIRFHVLDKQFRF